MRFGFYPFVWDCALVLSKNSRHLVLMISPLSKATLTA